MSQLLIPERTPLICTEGVKMCKLVVTNQTTYKSADGRLYGTYKDKMDENHNCKKLQAAGALLGTVLAVALVVSAPVSLVGVVVGAAIGGVASGVLVNKIPSLCAMISNNQWTLYHPTLKIEGLYALPEKALLPCFLGGVVKIKLIDWERTLKMALMSDQIYQPADPLPEAMQEMGISVVSNDELLENGFDPKILNNPGSGFYGRVYKVKNDDGSYTYVLAFKGTDNENQAGKDWKTNIGQGVGLNTEQYKQTAKVSIQFNKKFGPDIAITGHSKAGGQATLGGAITGAETTVFNPAGVHDKTFKRNDVSRSDASHVNSFHAQDKDILNSLSDNLPILPAASGDRMGMDTDASPLFKDPIDGHGMSHLINKIKEELAENPPLKVKASTI